ncbi:MAG TPA: tRNA uridine-5-carboxymethylaminomethyl(34) synthesis GTPase MnmE [Nevskiaceae bacterium]|nr:tRNA uridine-5-carboxymethylaminomethyl(34) synthesis GTPase MnmE [Nevskiaceae bacterium]
MSAAAETIAAIATASGRGAVGIVRISGPCAASIAQSICGPIPPARVATLRRFRDASGEVIDHGLVLYFPGPHSFTGEDVVELQGHGGPIVLDALVQAARSGGARVARPGEFSERAFLNGRMDLVQAEAIADLIDAASREAARAANRSMEGAFSARIAQLQTELTELRVFVEGALDFSDEDVAWLADPTLRERLHRLDAALDATLALAAHGRRLRDGLTVAIAGQPNVGKSTLLNRLAGADRAIVTDIAGTTRDVLREDIVLDGLPLTVLDTAGLRDSDDPVEREGIRRAWHAAHQAEAIVFVADDQHTEGDDALLEKLPREVPIVVVRNKCDLSGAAPARSVERARVTLRLSAHTGAGIEQLIAELKAIAGVSTTQGLFSARARHIDALHRTREHVRAAQRSLGAGATAELAAEDLRLAQRALGEIVGEVTSEELLGEIFSRFCIGK